MTQWGAVTVPAPTDPDQAAREAAGRAGVVTRELSGLPELARVDGLFAAIWGPAGGQVGMPVNLLQALVHSGNYVAGAWRGPDLVAAAVAFLGCHDGRPELHSHVAGVSRPEQGTGVGRALKLHQRAWAHRRGIGTVTWTFDPLIRRNGWFNLATLGAAAVSYHPDFYGPMVDDLNGRDETDRCLVRWDTSGSPPARPSPEGGAVALSVGPGGIPEVHRFETDGRPLLCQVPVDVVAVRLTDPDLARRWRLALRATMGRAMAAGYQARTMTPDGSYRLEPAG